MINASGQSGFSPGLCASCVHARTIAHPRGGTPYWLCARAAEDPSYLKYPRLPVLRCAGFEERMGE